MILWELWMKIDWFAIYPCNILKSNLVFWTEVSGFIVYLLLGRKLVNWYAKVVYIRWSKDPLNVILVQISDYLLLIASYISHISNNNSYSISTRSVKGSHPLESQEKCHVFGVDFTKFKNSSKCAHAYLRN